MGFLDILTASKHPRQFPVFLPAIGSAVVLLTKPGRITRDLTDNLVCGIKHLRCLRVCTICSDKPSLYIFPASLHPFIYLLFIHFHINSGNRHFIGCDFFKHILDDSGFYFLQCLLDDCHIELETFDKGAQILEQPILKNQKFSGFHHLLCLYAIQFPHIVLIILVQTDKVVVEVVPPSINFLCILIQHFFHSRQGKTETFQKCRLQ